jgi:hypothetical protein
MAYAVGRGLYFFGKVRGGGRGVLPANLKTLLHVFCNNASTKKGYIFYYNCNSKSCAKNFGKAAKKRRLMPFLGQQGNVIAKKQYVYPQKIKPRKRAINAPQPHLQSYAHKTKNRQTRNVYRVQRTIKYSTNFS